MSVASRHTHASHYQKQDFWPWKWPNLVRKTQFLSKSDQKSDHFAPKSDFFVTFIYTSRDMFLDKTKNGISDQNIAQFGQKNKTIFVKIRP